MGPGRLDAFPLPATARLEPAHPLSIREEYELRASTGTAVGVGMGASGIPKRREPVSVCGDGSGQALNVFKTQQVLQARAEDLTAVLFQHSHNENVSHKFSPRLLTCICGSKRIYGESGVKQLGKFFRSFPVSCARPVAVAAAILSLSRAEFATPWKHYAASSRTVALSSDISSR